MIQKQNFRNWKDLAQYLEIQDLQTILPISHFPLNLPRRLAAKIQKNSLSDPILRQFLPTTAETSDTPGYFSDPVGDAAARKTKKLLSKYQGRALILASSACAMHCRYCFRQNFEYAASDNFEDELRQAAADPTLSEIILSGGDPLSLANPALDALIGNLAAIPHLTKLRFHTRFPIGIPERIDGDFLKILENCRLQTVFVVHCNHAKELDKGVLDALKKVQRLGIPVLNQAVLLRGVNDSVEAMRDLLQTLTDHGIIPYYLNQLDRVQGASHFEVPEEEGLKIMQQLRTLLPGYAIPRYIREIAGQPNKTPLF